MFGRYRSLIVIIGIMICLVNAGCGSSGSSSSSFNPKTACSALNGTQIPAESIGLPTKGANVIATEFIPASDTSAEYCNATIEIKSVDPQAQPITMVIHLPSQWNYKLIQLHAGGYAGKKDAGFLLDQAGYLNFGPQPKGFVGSGYVTFTGDDGHTDPSLIDPRFLLNEEELMNYAHEAIKKTHDTAVALVKAFYNGTPTRAYYIGGSGGGRMALQAVQHYPDDYDGVISLFPVLDWTPLVMKWQQVGVAMRGGTGAGWINVAKAITLQNAVYAACDGLDGLVDGVISNLNACNFDHTTLRCPGGGDTGDNCLSDAQIQTVTILQSTTPVPYQFANGVTSLPASNVGTDNYLMFGNTPVYTVQPVPDATALGLMPQFPDGWVRYVITKQPTVSSLTFDPLNPGAYLSNLLHSSEAFDATNPDISRFINKGGKLFIVHGNMDSISFISQSVDYYNRLVGLFGQQRINDAVRFYTIPGYGHVSGNFQPAPFPHFPALVNWVENGKEPVGLILSDVRTTTPVNRPQCEYPKWPKYNGSGDPNAASSFTCVAN